MVDVPVVMDVLDYSDDGSSGSCPNRMLSRPIVRLGSPLAFATPARRTERDDPARQH
ncbi:hypothetical protein SAMN05216557_10488 [Sphingomonas carotinifaciens]|uniref:Uncharacterized protein n=1 Tax=Sphingomonas carotinifaciens TaxID=1166323 RepID=A0A1G7M6U9_9SPHN|nr:hypothetical protein [Sphingomonas carotinifaciens]SDF57366.1 hypothetical protein SAMN05216557_10488 [Sphingomonas carotinifaciens]